jgi:hypothetical protein
MDFGTAEEIPVECEYPVLTIKHNDGKSWQADISNRITQFHKLPCFFVVSELGGGGTSTEHLSCSQASVTIISALHIPLLKIIVAAYNTKITLSLS